MVSLAFLPSALPASFLFLPVAFLPVTAAAAASSPLPGWLSGECPSGRTLRAFQAKVRAFLPLAPFSKRIMIGSARIGAP